MTKVYEFVVVPSAGHEELYGESLYIVSENENDLRLKFDAWIEKNYLSPERWRVHNDQLTVDKIWDSRKICSDESGDGVFARKAIGNNPYIDGKWTYG